ncbi:MAG: 50S ribosomal protein L15 [Tepidiformaceae bacterium]
MDASQLRPDKGATHSRKRVGRGNSSGQGTYAGKGLKGQKSRSGKGVRLGFEGGQLPLVRRMHVLRGFNNKWRVEYQPINLGELERFDDGATVTPESLKAAGLLRQLREPVKVLARGELTRKLDITAHRFSEAARARIEELGGSATLVAPEEPAKDE